MLHRIIAPVGSGKKDRILSLVKDAFSKGKRVFLLVPEQATARYERDVTSLLGNRGGELVEVTNFSRLPDVILRKVGGLGDRVLTDTAKKALLFSCVRGVKDSETALPLRCDADCVDSLFRELEELRLAGLSPESLFSFSENEELPLDTREKFRALSLLRAAFVRGLSSFGEAAEGQEKILQNALKITPFFRDSEVFVDAFWDFTAPQERILREILLQADRLTVTFASDEKGTYIFSKPARAAERLAKIAKKEGHAVTEEYLSREESGEIAFLKKNLAGGREKMTEAPENITLTAAESVSEEAHAVAREILRLVQGGARWREIAVLCRDEARLSVLRMTLEEESVPVFSEEKKPLSQSPAARTLLLACRIADGKARREELRAFVKRGLFLADEEERFLLDQYLATWRLSCRELLGDKDFAMNPYGYLEKNSESDEELRKVNRARKSIFFPLARLAVALEKETVEEKTVALLSYLEEIGAEGLLAEEMDNKTKSGDFSAAAAVAREWNSLLLALDEIRGVAGEEKISREEYFQLLTLAFSRSLPGEVPPGQDLVQLGTLGFARPEGTRHLFLCGLNSKVFPADSAGAGYLTDREKEFLFSEGYPVSTGDSGIHEEYFLFYQAVAFAEKSLHLSFVSAAADKEKKHDLSIFGKRVETLFPALKMKIFRSAEAKPLSSEQGFGYTLRRGVEGEEEKKWWDHFSKDPAFSARTLDALSGKAYREAPYRLENTLPYEGKDAHMTYSRIEKYSNCPFSFFSRYLLEAKARGQAEFGSNIIGNFAHSVLEKVMIALAAKGLEIKDAPDDILKAENRIACQSTVEETITLSEGATAEHLIRRMEENTLAQLRLIKRQFRVSGFSPLFFEKDLFDLNPPDQNGKKKVYAIPLSDGTNLVLGGKIDRVDLYTNTAGKKFVRVVDYKTGNHTFSLDDVANGVSIQMLLYLFSLCKIGFTVEDSKGNAEKILPEPAGILYMNGTLATKDCATPEDLKKRAAAPESDFSLKGLLVRDDELLAAQDPDGKGEFLPVKKKKDKNTNALYYPDVPALITVEKLGRLNRSVERIFTQLAENLKAGRIDAVPLYRGSRANHCAWCDYAAICKKPLGNPRYFKKKTGDSLVSEEVDE